MKIFGFFCFFCIFLVFMFALLRLFSLITCFTLNKVDRSYEFLRQLFRFIEAGEKVGVHLLFFDSPFRQGSALPRLTEYRTVNSVLLL